MTSAKDAADELLEAVAHLLRRIGEDPGGLGYHGGRGTQVFALAVAAYAKAVGCPAGDVEREVLDAQKRYEDLEAELETVERRAVTLRERLETAQRGDRRR